MKRKFRQGDDSSSDEGIDNVSESDCIISKAFSEESDEISELGSIRNSPPVIFHTTEGLRVEKDGADLESRSVDESSNTDSVSLHSLDTIEEAIQNNAEERQHQNQTSLRHQPIGGIFNHILLKEAEIDCDEYHRQQEAFINGDTLAERTTTRNTPGYVLEALDRDLRFLLPAVTVDALVAKYNVIKLVIKRRIDHLRSLGYKTPGIKFDNSFGPIVSESNAVDKLVIDLASGSKLDREKLYHDIQFLSPPVTVRELAQMYGVHLPTLHAQIYNLRNKGIITNGIVSGGARGRPRKPFLNLTNDITSQNEAFETEEVSSKHLQYISNKRGALKYFTAEEDATLTRDILQCVETGARVDWGLLDKQFDRTRGAAKQRWLKTVERKVGEEIRSSLRTRLYSLYILGAASHCTTVQSAPKVPNAAAGKADAVVSAVVSNMSAAVQLAHDTYPYHILTLGTGSAAPRDRPSGSAPGPSEAIHRRGVLAPAPPTAQRRAFTEEEDALIISTVLENRQLGVQRFWRALDDKLQRHAMAAKSRWQRALEPLVHDRIAASLYARGNQPVLDVVQVYQSLLPRDLSSEVDTASTIQLVLADMLAAVTQSFERIEDNAAGFSLDEDSIIIETVKEWELDGVFHWSQLDAELRRPLHTCLVRYKTVLNVRVPAVVNTDLAPVLCAINPEGRPGKLPSCTPLSLLAHYYARWSDTSAQSAHSEHVTPRSTDNTSSDQNNAIVRTVLEHVIGAAIANNNEKKKSDSTAATISTAVNAPLLNHPQQVTGEINKEGNRFRRFSPEEDAYVSQQIAQMKEQGRTVNWSALDKALGRSTGAVRQRWKKVLATAV